MNQERTLNPAIVHDAAAYLFWTLADEVGVDTADEAVIESGGQCLLEQPFTMAVLSQYGVEGLPHNDQHEFGRAIAIEAERFAVKGENMGGIIYAEDAQGGKSPSAQHVNTDLLKSIPKRVTTGGVNIEKIGRLCLRHPLPAVVFSETKQHSSVIEVGDTMAALGFYMPMFLAVSPPYQQLADRLFVFSGVFQIPVMDTRYGDRWSHAIQNSMRFVDRFVIHGESGDTTVKVEW